MLTTAVRRLRSLRWLLVPAMLTGALMLAAPAPAPALADCSQLDPWPSFRQAAPSARTILIGTVTWTPGGKFNSLFTLRVDEVLRGRAPAEIEIKALHSGLPETICPRGSDLKVRFVGERLAIAYDAHLPGQRRTITAVAFVKPSRPDRFFMPEMERLSASEVRGIAVAPPATDASAPELGRPVVPRFDIRAALPWAAGSAALLAALLGAGRRRRPA